MRHDSTRISSGTPGLDEILNGGFVGNRGYLLRGGPGTGKTTLGTQFLVEGTKQNDRCLHITLGESELDLKKNAHGIGIDTTGINYLDLSPESEFFAGAQGYDLFSPGEIERDPLTRKIMECVERVKPKRIFLDSTSHLRYLSIDAHQFRKQLMSFLRYLLELDCVVLFTSEGTRAQPDDDVMYLSDGVINLSLSGRVRTIEVTKFRGSDFRVGSHTLKLTHAGAVIYPTLIPAEHSRKFDPQQMKSGVVEIDELLRGGLESGTISLITGPAGVGKTTMCLQFATAVATENKRVCFISFEESNDSLIYRAEMIGIPLRSMIERDRLKIITVEPLLFTGNEIAALIRREIEVCGTHLVIFDGIRGYQLSVVGDVQAQLRGIFKYLTNMGVSVLAVNETENITGDFRATEIGISYMADNIVFLRYLELRGEMRKAIGVLKKRLGDFERHLREFSISTDGIQVGRPLKHLRGILKGVPEWIDSQESHE